MNYVINGDIQALEESITFADRHYVPLNALVQALGGSTQWDNTTKSATITLNGKTASVSMASDSATVDSKTVSLHSPTIVQENTMYVPWDFFQDAFGYKTEIENEILSIRS